MSNADRNRYAEAVTSLSEGELQAVLEAAEPPVCLLGGWAVNRYVDRGRFGFYQQFDRDTGDLLDDDAARDQPSHTVFRLDVDIIPDTSALDTFQEVFGFRPPAEPLKDLADLHALMWYVTDYDEIKPAIREPLTDADIAAFESMLSEDAYERTAGLIDVDSTIVQQSIERLLG